MKIMKNSPSIPQRVLVEQESGSEVVIPTPTWLSLAKKSGKSDVSLSILEQVYVRGLLESNPQSKNSPEQQAFNRVNSFLHEGKAYELDYDLICEAPKVPDGRKHMNIIKDAVRRYETKNEPEQQPVEEGIGRYARYGLPGLAVGAVVGVGKAVGGIARKARTGHFTKKGWHGSAEYQGQQQAKRREADYLGRKYFHDKYPEAEPAGNSSDLPHQRKRKPTIGQYRAKIAQKVRDDDVASRDDQARVSDFSSPRAYMAASRAAHKSGRKLTAPPKPETTKVVKPKNNNGSRSIAYDTAEDLKGQLKRNLARNKKKNDQYSDLKEVPRSRFAGNPASAPKSARTGAAAPAPAVATRQRGTSPRSAQKFNKSQTGN